MIYKIYLVVNNKIETLILKLWTEAAIPLKKKRKQQLGKQLHSHIQETLLNQHQELLHPPSSQF